MSHPEDEDELPPLEDMTEVVDVIRSQKDTLLVERRKREVEEATRRAEEAAKKKQAEEAAKKAKQAAIDKQGMFPGLKAGFLLGQGKKGGTETTSSTKGQTEAKQQVKKDGGGDSRSEVGVGDGIPFIRPNVEAANSSLRIPEVEAAMEVSRERGWVTPTLLSEVERNEAIMKGMQNPKIQKAMEEIRANPAQALKKYSSDAEIGAFVQQWIGFMSSQAKKQNSQNDDGKREGNTTENKTPTSTKSNQLKGDSKPGPSLQALNTIATPPQPSSSPSSSTTTATKGATPSQSTLNKPRNGPLIELIDDDDSNTTTTSTSSASTASTYTAPKQKSPAVSKPSTTTKPTPVSTSTTSRPSASSPSSSSTSSSSPSSDTFTFGPNQRQVSREQMIKWMTHPVISAALNDPLTSQMLTALKQNQDTFPQLIKDPRIQVLVQAGILEVPAKYASAYHANKR